MKTLSICSSSLANFVAIQNGGRNLSRPFRRNLAWMLSDPENKGSRQQHINFDNLGTCST
ncbi:hypothetical protein QR98_0052030 [Sarcoptes scabiei]|uniref:Uncharacterized protein n=1 Tax=Sarcoptes scabiei TaxID=52283 RepID=A0A132A7W5_SARSC|nr:hypothetical protein QR98_0052030 [Sarcoptes scabiei]